ncbi:hypothetical protein [Plesiomonas sp. PI-19]|uniref:hypothetical protein n=1 Tax=Plesiomonas sp. PI-19 TaxID=2898798 RepID=UPI001F24D6E3|nr:hypothetical protein [Plesiomonas sp. PI-19]MCE5162750.1 hypothetical protein [Plesiomonas sp. PI-19]
MPRLLSVHYAHIDATNNHVIYMALIESCQLKAVNTSEAARLQLSDSLKCDQKQKCRVVAARYASTLAPRYMPREHAEESAKKDKKRDKGKGKGKNRSAGNLLGNSTAAAASIWPPPPVSYNRLAIRYGKINVSLLRQ